MTGILSPGFTLFVDEIAERKSAFGLVSEIDDDGLGRYGDDGAFHLRLGLATVFALKLRECVVEGLSGFGTGCESGELGFDTNDSELKNSSLEVVTRVALEEGLMLAAGGLVKS